MMISLIHHFFFSLDKTWYIIITSAGKIDATPNCYCRGDQWASYNQTTRQAPPTSKGDTQVLRYAGADNTCSPTVHILFLNTPVFLLPRFLTFSHTKFLHSRLIQMHHTSFSQATFCPSYMLPKPTAALLVILPQTIVRRHGLLDLHDLAKDAGGEREREILSQPIDVDDMVVREREREGA